MPAEHGAGVYGYPVAVVLDSFNRSMAVNNDKAVVFVRGQEGFAHPYQVIQRLISE